MRDDGVLVSGDRVALRYAAESDRDAFVALRRASRVYLERWEPLPPAGFNAYGDDAFDRDLGCACLEDQERWLIVRVSDGALVGRLAVTAIERGPFQNGRFGYWMGEAFAGKGYMTEALGLGLRRCFGPLGLHRVEANILPRNGASRRVLEKAGFRCEGVSPRYLQIAGSWADHERWAVTVEDWAG